MIKRIEKERKRNCNRRSSFIMALWQNPFAGWYFNKIHFLRWRNSKFVACVCVVAPHPPSPAAISATGKGKRRSHFLIAIQCPFPYPTIQTWHKTYPTSHFPIPTPISQYPNATWEREIRNPVTGKPPNAGAPPPLADKCSRSPSRQRRLGCPSQRWGGGRCPLRRRSPASPLPAAGPPPLVLVPHLMLLAEALCRATSRRRRRPALLNPPLSLRRMRQSALSLLRCQSLAFLVDLLSSSRRTTRQQSRICDVHIWFKDS